jgi:oligopeptide/dipeptide ABC transporter ATP-binding protein
MSRAILNMLPPGSAQRSGSVVFNGHDMFSLRGRELQRVVGREIAYIPQHPMTSLNPVMTIGEQLGESLRLHLGMNHRQAREEAIALLASVGIPAPRQRIEEYPHQMSGGMCQRVAIAIALACQPKLLVADEPTTALDVTVQAQIIDLLMAQQADRGMALIIVTHDFGVAASCADRVGVMYGGRLMEMAGTAAIFANHRMRYTEALLRAIPRLDQPLGMRLKAIAGQPADPLRLPAGCPFERRCTSAVERCKTEMPPVSVEDAEHWYTCWNPVPQHVDAKVEA